MLRLSTRDPGFAKAFARLVADRRESDANVARDVTIILEDVRRRCDAAAPAPPCRKRTADTIAPDPTSPE